MGAEDVLSHYIAEAAKSEIDLTPPESVRKAAARGLVMRREAAPSKRGGITTKEAGKQGIGSGVARAASLKSGKAVSAETIRRMCAFFSRHEKNKATPKGKIAWLLWGGDPGRRWAEAMRKRLDAATASMRDHPEWAEVKKILGITYDDLKGLGSVPNGQEIDYRGFTVMMPARTYLRLAYPRDFENRTSSKDYLIEAVKEGKSLGYPYLLVNFSAPLPVVYGHDGRTRVHAISEIYGGQKPIAVHIFVTPGRAKNMALDKIITFRAGAKNESGQKVLGPLFQSEVKWLGKIHDLSLEEQAA